ncbi:glycosyltransferase [Roseateles cellulosilyticus]|uniref:Glycosyltransferase n=1 Tax=Pelomonas cellulosilytica TaxID=2906762 RepID=A0ABS8XN94_9BURK|nr:glycosyltransferase [Pelomonas sp. P8]MCE4553117.1 glycosyltransferase [Pelomonas sp. P8]
MTPPPVLIVFSHLRWGFVYQRPQQLMSRLAGRWRVVFVEEPVPCDGPAWLEVRDIAPQLQVLVPHTPVATPGFHDNQLAALQTLLDVRFAGPNGADVAWLYTPMALPLVPSVSPTCIVYDCMDELSAFKDAPRQLRQRESALMKSAAVVFTGGPSLYEARRSQHPDVVCLPSAVDAVHFDPVRLDPLSPHAAEVERLQGHLPGPKLGFFGVIDERFDASLVAAVADAHPEWSLVMVGPVVKIDPASLPRRDNIHWLGMQSYEGLPHLLQGWDVALMPFARNESTRFISPTKTLEYMAGGKPVVSTPINDVVSLYGHAVEVADGPAAFVRACETLLSESQLQRLHRTKLMADAVARHAWDRSADIVHMKLTKALRDADRAVTPAPLTTATPLAAAGGLRL